MGSEQTFREEDVIIVRVITWVYDLKMISEKVLKVKLLSGDFTTTYRR